MEPPPFQLLSNVGVGGHGHTQQGRRRRVRMASGLVAGIAVGVVLGLGLRGTVRSGSVIRSVSMSSSEEP